MALGAASLPTLTQLSNIRDPIILFLRPTHEVNYLTSIRAINNYVAFHVPRRLTMFVWRKRSGINVQVGIDFDCRNLKKSEFRIIVLHNFTFQNFSLFHAWSEKSYKY